MYYTVDCMHVSSTRCSNWTVHCTGVSASMWHPPYQTVRVRLTLPVLLLPVLLLLLLEIPILRRELLVPIHTIVLILLITSYHLPGTILALPLLPIVLLLPIVCPMKSIAMTVKVGKSRRMTTCTFCPSSLHRAGY